MMYFIAEQNGTLSLPMDQQGFENNSGYTLAPGASATLTFEGEVLLGNGHIIIDVTPGVTYRVIVHGNDGAYATANVTAT